MANIFDLGDALGPAKVVHVHEPSLGLKAVLVVDNVACGPAIGGLRMAPDVSVEECARLARAMTLKNAAAGLPHGGGKSVLWGDPRMPRERKERLIRAFAHALRNETDYIFGPDMGTDEDLHGVDQGRDRARGRPAGARSAASRWMRSARPAGASATPPKSRRRHCGLTLEGARVAIQGFGAVGKHAARFLAPKARGWSRPPTRGGTLARSRRPRRGRADRAQERGQAACVTIPSGEKLERDAVIDIDCDIWIPAARPDVVREDNVERLQDAAGAAGREHSVHAGRRAGAARRGACWWCRTSSPTPAA